MQRDANPSILWRPPLLPPPPFFRFCPTSYPTSLSPPTPTLTVLSNVLFLWLNGWSRHIWYAILLSNNMDLHMFSLGTLVPEGPSCALWKKSINFTEVWDIMWFFTGALIWYHTYKHTTHSGAPRLTHLYNIYLQHLLCAHSSYLYYIKWSNE